MTSLLKAQGRLMAIGGAEDKTGECRILKEFVRLPGGENAEIVLMTAATDSPEKTADEYKNVFHRLGVKHMRHVSISERADALKPKTIKPIEKASGFIFHRRRSASYHEFARRHGFAESNPRTLEKRFAGRRHERGGGDDGKFDDYRRLVRRQSASQRGCHGSGNRFDYRLHH
jgi:hypothetical protein